MVVETGRPLLDRLDVIEAGSGAGRGAMQYTGPRRLAYKRARTDADARGIDTAGKAWQQRYFAEEYTGLQDPPGGSLISWTRNLRQGRLKGTQPLIQGTDLGLGPLKRSAGLKLRPPGTDDGLRERMEGVLREKI